MHRDFCPLDCKVYVGNLGNNDNKTELERAFGYYGPLWNVWVARKPLGFAFVEFEDPQDAADTVRELDGRTLCGCQVRVELSNGEMRSRNRGPPPSWGRHPWNDYQRRSPPPPRRSPKRRSFSLLEIGEERDYCPGREITSCPDLSLGLRANLGQMKGNRPVCKRSGVQEITSFDRSMYRKFKFCLRIHKLGAFLKCFSCSHLFVGTVTQRCNSLWFEMDHMRHVISRIVTLQCSLKQNLICFGF